MGDLIQAIPFEWSYQLSRAGGEGELKPRSAGRNGAE